MSIADAQVVSVESTHRREIHGDKSDDVALIESSILALPTTGGVVYLPPREAPYRIERPLTIAKSRTTLWVGACRLVVRDSGRISVTGDSVKIRGEGNTSLIDARDASGSVSVIQVEGNYVTLDSFSMRGNGWSGGSARLIVLTQGTTGHTVHRISLVGSGAETILVRSSATAITHCLIDSSGLDGIRMDEPSARDVTVANTRIYNYNTRQNNGSAAISALGMSKVRIRANQISRGNGNGVRIERRSGILPRDIIVSDNSVDITMMPVSSEGITANGNNIVIQGNRVNMAYASSILAWCPPDDTLQNILITKNVLSNGSQDPMFSHGAIHVEVNENQIRDISIVGNVAFDNQPTPTMGSCVIVQDFGKGGTMHGGIIVNNVGINLAAEHAVIYKPSSLAAGVIEYGNSFRRCNEK